MVYNNIINHLKLWCINKAKAYEKAYGNWGGVTYMGYIAAGELKFKLSTLIDKPFESKEALKKAVLDFVDEHYEHAILNPQNNTAKHIVEKINGEFLAYLEELFSKNEELALADLPYARVIVGEEAAALQEKFRSVWGYVNKSCWYPLMGDHPKEVAEKFFVMYDYFEPYREQLEQLIGLPQTHMYSNGERNYRYPDYCLETVELTEYGGLETIYTDKDFSWAIYFSHENTVAFAGSIVPEAKELLAKEKEHWDKFEWN